MLPIPLTFFFLKFFSNRGSGQAQAKKKIENLSFYRTIPLGGVKGQKQSSQPYQLFFPPAETQTRSIVITL